MNIERLRHVTFLYRIEKAATFRGTLEEEAKSKIMKPFQELLIGVNERVRLLTKQLNRINGRKGGITYREDG